MKKIIGWFVAGLFLLGMITLTTPHLILTILWSGLRDERKSAYRKRLSGWALAWGRRYLVMCQKLMRLRIDYDVQLNISTARHGLGKVPSPSPIIIANHRTALDHLIVAMVAGKYFGLNDIRWVLKDQMRHAPVVGWLMQEMGSAFVTRDRNPQDKGQLQDMATLARLDNAAVMIYPEGTRFNGTPQPGSAYQHLRDPKVRGFTELCGNLQTRSILVIVIDWGELQGGKTMWDGNAFVGHHVRVQAYPIDNPGFAHAKECLIETWSDADLIIAARGKVKARPWSRKIQAQ